MADGCAPTAKEPPSLPAAGWRAAVAALQRGYATLEARLGGTLFGHGWRRANELNLVTQSLALAAQQMLCTAPLLVAFSGVIQDLRGHGIGGVLGSYLGLSAPAAADVSALFNGSGSISNADTVVGLALALLFATGVAATQQRGYELIWSRRRSGLRSVLSQLVWVAVLVAYLAVVLYAGRAGHRAGRRVHAGQPAGPLVQFVVSFLFFWLSQRLLLARRVSWRRLLPGAVFMAAGMTALVGLSGLVMSGQIVSQVADYGLIGATFVLSVWLVALSGVVFGGAFLGMIVIEWREGLSLTDAPVVAAVTTPGAGR